MHGNRIFLVQQISSHNQNSKHKYHQFIQFRVYLLRNITFALLLLLSILVPTALWLYLIDLWRLQPCLFSLQGNGILSSLSPHHKVVVEIELPVRPTSIKLKGNCTGTNSYGHNRNATYKTSVIFQRIINDA